MFESLYNLFRKANLLDETKAWYFVMDNDVKEEIIRLNTEDQLYEDGIDSRGDSLGSYSPYTVAEKRLKGQRYDHVTLNDEGDFYDSFVVVIKRDSFEIIADDSSKYDNPLTDIYGAEIIGLTTENIASLKELILENYQAYVREELLH